MLTERLERRTQLLAYVQDCIQRQEAGEISGLPTYQYLSDQFGYKSLGSLAAFLNRRGIRLGEYKPPYQLPEPSPDLAWFLGVLSAGGSVNPNKGSRVEYRSVNAGVLEKFRLIGERLFSLNANRKPSEEKSGGRAVPGYEFGSVKVARFLGNLRSDSWAETILSVHPWVVDSSRYTWGFINGFFEERGGVYTRPRHRVMVFTSFPSGANLLAEMLVRQGLERPNIEHISRPVEKVRNVQILNRRDIRLFAQLIHSEIPEKEEALAYYRK